ncbi:hypothetical protein EVAR_12464_1 [Eumeta japonica]|uniref:Uncharacterized protein n=1 Tax=Eumeta variegata TaxID=151549 RepID=A0A4C1TPH5_EUMVA|nr:hypothetical protein EVAR_12464_1 [Eumeta japonica]
MQQKANITRCSQAVTHPSTDRARRCLTSVIGREPVYSAWQLQRLHLRTPLAAAVRSLRVVLFTRARTRYRYLFLKTTGIASTFGHRGQRRPSVRQFKLTCHVGLLSNT